MGVQTLACCWGAELACLCAHACVVDVLVDVLMDVLGGCPLCRAAVRGIGGTADKLVASGDDGSVMVLSF